MFTPQILLCYSQTILAKVTFHKGLIRKMLVFPYNMINKEIASVYQKVKYHILACDKIPTLNLICFEVY